MQPTLSLIVATNQDNVIGIENRLPWRLPADLQYFKKVTLGKPVIMGRLTWESLGRPLPGRKNIVITRNDNYVAEGATVVSNLDEAILLAKQHTDEEVMIIGGAQIYQLALPLVERIYKTEVDVDVNGDAFFPELNDDWQEISREKYSADEKNGHNYQFVIYQR